MRNICFKIQYDGTRYSGWQRQGNTGNTIEEKLKNILVKMTGDTSIELHGSGRTDAGVHAEGQVANCHMNTDLSADEILQYMNKYLPEDISVKEVREAAPRFHSRLNAKAKTYTYTIDTGVFSDVFMRKYAYHHPEKLNADDMRKAAFYLLGEHDFKSFSDLKSNKKSTVRSIYSIDISENENFIIISYRGNGFLYHMVRLITGFLIQVGEGKYAPETVEEILERKERLKDMMLAPAKGLKLLSVEY